MSDFVDSLTSAHMDAAPAQPQDTRLVQNLRRASIFIPLSMLLIGMFITALHWYMTRGGADIPMESPDFVNNIVTLHAIERLGGTDSWNPMLAVRDWLWSNPDSDAYEHFFFGLGTKFQYPLTSLLALQWLPLGGTSDIRFLNILAVLAWISIAPGMMLLDLQLARLLTLPGQRDGRLWLMACAALGTLCFYPLMRAVYLGQIQIFLDALFVFACYFLARGQSRWAGILIGLSALVKPQMALSSCGARYGVIWLLSAGRGYVVSWAISFQVYCTDGHGRSATCMCWALSASMAKAFTPTSPLTGCLTA